MLRISCGEDTLLEAHRFGHRVRGESSPLREPTAAFLVAEDNGVLPRVEHELEVAADERLLSPPAVDVAPLLTHERDRMSIH